MNILINGGLKGIGRAKAFKHAGGQANNIIAVCCESDTLKSLSGAAVKKNISVMAPSPPLPAMGLNRL